MRTPTWPSRHRQSAKTTHPDPRGWPFLPVVALGAGFDGYCLADIARASPVRYLPKWA